VVCLCAAWCGACRDYRAVLAQVALQQPQLRFAWVDVEDHADLADDFDVQTFPTLYIAGSQGVHFAGPVLPHAATLERMLTALPAARAPLAYEQGLLAALQAAPANFAV
jgi:thioredoxin-like negative regulator of GroEL